MSAFAEVKDSDDAMSIDLSDNVVEDVIEYVRGQIVGHEEEALLMYLGTLSGYGYHDSFHINTIGQGPPGSGKSLTKNTINDLLPSQDTYTKTDASSNAILDSREWDLSLVAVLDEYDKIDRNIIEVLKSSNDEDGGYSKDRNVEDQDAAGGYSPVEVGADAIPWVVLYAPSSKKGGINDELADRALKLYFSNDKHTRRGIGRKEFGHDDIQIQTDEYEYDYIYDTHKLGAALRQHIRQFAVEGIMEETEDGEEYLASRSGDTLVWVPPWVWYTVEPIFNIDEDYTNRVYGIVNNLIKASALLNHENRNRKITDVYVDPDSEEQEEREAVVVAPQDVANVLSCLPSLLSTTHQLTPLKRHILDAVDETEPMTDSDGTTVTKVQEYLEENDIPHPTRQTLKGRMDELAEEYYLIRHDSVAGPKGQADSYAKASQGALQTPRVNSLQSHADRDDVELASEACVEIDPADPFDRCHDPIRDQDFVETVTQFDAQFSGGSVEDDDPLTAAMGPSADESEYASSGTPSSDSNPKGSEGEDGASQASLSESTDGEISDTVDYTIDTDESPSNPTQQFVLEQLREERGNTYAKHHEVIQKMGVVADDENPSQVDLSGTVADPDHELWQDRADLTDDRVISEEDALRELEQAYANLKQQGLVEELTGKENNVPPAMCRLKVS